MSSSAIEIRGLLENGVSPMSVIKTAEMFNYIINHCPDDYSIHHTFRKDALGNPSSNTRDLVAQTRTIAKTGFISLINDHFLNVIDGLKADFLPRDDTDVLQMMCCKDPATELSGIIQILKLHKDDIAQSIKINPVDTQMSTLETDIEKEKFLSSNNRASNCKL